MAERFLLDENVPSSVVALLRKKRFEVRTVMQVSGPGTSNGQIAQEASRSGEIIITLDSDFLKLHPNPRAKIIFVDVHPAIPSIIGQVLDAHLEHCVQLLRTNQRVKLAKTGPAPAED